MSLTAKQERFVQEYLVDYNGTQAAIRSGYSETNAAQIASVMLRNPNVKSAVDAGQANLARRNEMLAQQVIDELRKIAFSDLGELLEFTDKGIRFKAAGQFSEAARRAVSSVKIRHEYGGEDKPPADIIEFKLWNKVDALSKLAQHLGLLKEIHEHSGPGGAPIQIVRGIDPEAALGDPATQP